MTDDTTTDVRRRLIDAIKQDHETNITDHDWSRDTESESCCLDPGSIADVVIDVMIPDDAAVVTKDDLREAIDIIGKSIDETDAEGLAVLERFAQALGT